MKSFESAAGFSFSSNDSLPLFIIMNTSTRARVHLTTDIPGALCMARGG